MNRRVRVERSEATGGHGGGGGVRRTTVWTNELLELFCSRGVSFFLPEEVIKRDSHSRTPLALSSLVQFGTRRELKPLVYGTVLVRVFPCDRERPVLCVSWATMLLYQCKDDYVTMNGYGLD